MHNVGDIADDRDDGAPLCSRGEFKGFNWSRFDDNDENDDGDDGSSDSSSDDSE